MESGIKFPGHPIHPMLIVFPLALLDAPSSLETDGILRSRERPGTARTGG